jgi:hypothetical protein
MRMPLISNFSKIALVSCLTFSTLVVAATPNSSSLNSIMRMYFMVFSILLWEFLDRQEAYDASGTIFLIESYTLG